VTPEAADYLAKARDYLDKAITWLDTVHRGDEAARTAYLAAFHAAQALVFERTGRIAKTHRGVRASFAKLAQSDPRIDRSFAQFLGSAYQKKEIVDYGVGSQIGIGDAEARDMIEIAVRFVDCIAEILAQEPS
jgi:uncharacterized protein (UPF0332 family)